MFRLAAFFSFAMLVVLNAAPASALPVFAHRYGLTCQTCHTAVPHLTAFGEAFRERGFRLAGTRPAPAFPAAVKVQLGYASEGEGGLPKAVVDEVEVLMGGSVGKRGSYFVEQYALDGGVPGRTRDLWAAWDATPGDARVPVAVRAGQFTLDLPVDPESFRETTDHYGIWDQTAGDNPFTFFAPKAGVMILAGSPGRGLSGSIAAVAGHDQASGLPSRGLDRHVFVQHAVHGLALSAYRYDGTRPVAGADDRFWREGYGIGAGTGRVRVELLYQRGFDTRASRDGALRSSGGFAQVRYDFTPKLFGIARYDGTQDAAFARSLIAGAGYRLARNARFTVFDTVHRDADTGTRRNTLSTQLLLAY
ncbi:MAG: hypothetical protein JWM87_3250 [Candidatus Eremiobacteraeota bacterium]|nr:hypothetical protein [Candidatus Eremiobacteraeota bacterium]